MKFSSHRCSKGLLEAMHPPHARVAEDGRGRKYRAQRCRGAVRGRIVDIDDLRVKEQTAPDESNRAMLA